MDLQQIITWAWEGEAFKQALLENHKATLEQARGITYTARLTLAHAARGGRQSAAGARTARTGTGFG